MAPTGRGLPGLVVLAGLFLIGGAVLAVVSLVLLTGGPRLDHEGTATSPDGSSDGSVTVEVRCASVGSGSHGAADYVDDDGVVIESGYRISPADPEAGLAEGEVDALCGRARAARTAHAVETTFFSLLLLGAGVTVLVVRRRPGAR